MYAIQTFSTPNKLIQVLFVVLHFYLNSVISERRDIHHMMYETFKDAAMCFRILNGTNQFGCSTSPSGRTGVVHLVKTAEDVQWLLNSGQAGPYMAVITPKMFSKSEMMMLRDSSKVSGVLLALNSSARSDHMSPDDTCPNRYSSLTDSCDDTDQWNPLGSGFMLVDWNIPLFAVNDPSVLKQIEDCYNQFNLPLDASQLDKPLCSLQMTGHMFAAVDTPTCKRRNDYVNSVNQITYCDDMGDQNLVSFLFPRQTAPNASVVMLTARMDAASMFDGLSPGAVTTVSSMVTVIIVAHLLHQLLPQYKDTYTKNVVFALLNGEAHDYIGSSRVVYDMQNGEFPSKNFPVLLEHLDQVIDLHQLDNNNSVYCHCFNSNRSQVTLETLVNVSKTFGTTVKGSCTSSRLLPPSSLHSFLKATNNSVAGIILTNHAEKYTNKFYNGLLDDSKNIVYHYYNGSGVPKMGIQASLAAISRTLALSLAQMIDSSVVWPTNITDADTASLVDELLHCYLETRQCKLFQKIGGPSVVGEEEGPLPLYVGVSKSSNQVTSATYLTLANLTGKRNNATEQQCNSPHKESNYSYVWIIGDEQDPGYCVETTLVYTPAQSPAFIIDNYNWTSGQYPTWTESVWQEVGLRMFVRPPFSQELTTLIFGLIVIFVSFISVHWINRNSDRLFTPVRACQMDDTAILLEQARNSAGYGCVNL